jgi:hypothetical protein
MFLQKLIKANSKITWALIDLLMIIIGVYCAFLIQRYSELERTRNEEERVLNALKIELEQFRFSMPQFASYMDDYLKKIGDDKEVNFSGWRYSEPQYAYQIIEYAMNLENSEIIDFSLYDNLQRLYVVIKQLEHTERSINQTSEKYRALVPELSNNHAENLARRADNETNLRWFKIYAKDRSSGLKRVAKVSEESLKSINERLGLEKQKEIERKMILSNMNKAANVDEAIGMVKQFFPNFSEEEIQELYKESQGK